MIYEYIKNNYKEAEPIFFSDLLKLEKNKYILSKNLSALVLDKKILKFQDGIYYLPKKTLLKSDIGISPDLVIKQKYICDGENNYGYYSSIYFANRLGLTTQVPSVVEIVTNNTNSSPRTITIKNQKYYIKPSKVIITNKNVYVLQLLNLIKDVEKYTEYSLEYTKTLIRNYVIKFGIKKKDIDEYIDFFPINTYKNFYKLELYDVFA